LTPAKTYNGHFSAFNFSLTASWENAMKATVGDSRSMATAGNESLEAVVSAAMTNGEYSKRSWVAYSVFQAASQEQQNKT